jgi:threonine dehydratase
VQASWADCRHGAGPSDVTDRPEGPLARVPTLVDVLAARKRIEGIVARTPLRRYRALDAELGADVAVKHENLQVTGAFKVRGGVNLLRHLEEEGLPDGVVAASTGNHGQSIAFGAGVVGAPCAICVPSGANPLKVRAIRELGAEIVAHGDRYDDAMHHAEALAVARGWRYVHSGDEPDLIAGVATATWEVLTEWPGAEVLVLPIGGGSQAAGACIVAKSLKPEVRVVGVQSSASPAAHRPWRTGRLETVPSRTLAEGFDTGTPFALPQQILRRLLDEFVLVEDEALFDAAADLMTATKTLVEPTGAAPLAAARSFPDLVGGRRAVLWCSGANIGPEHLADVAGRQRSR